MATGKKPARGGGSGRPSSGRQSSGRQSSGRPSSGATRQAAGGNRSGASATRQRAPGAGGKASGNGAGPSKPQQTGNGSAKGRSTTPAKPVRADAAAQAAPPPSGPVGRILAPFRTIGPVPLATFVLSLYALGASIYLTITHFDTHITLACSDKGLVNCAEVTTSSQSMVFGVIPVAVIGLAYYVFMVALNSPWVWRLQQTGSDQVAKILRYTRIGAIVAGMGFVLYLVFAELIQIGAICLWCTSVHVATFLIFALIVFYTSLSPSSRARPGRG
jgi:uncharacterized membrane protein